MRKEECTSWGEISKSKETLFRSYYSMISLRNLLLLLQILIQFSLFRERNRINSLKIIILFIPQKISRTILCDFKPFQLLCAPYMRTSTQINQSPTSIGRGKPLIRNLCFNEILFIGVTFKQLERLLLVQYYPLEFLFLAYVFFDLFL